MLRRLLRNRFFEIWSAGLLAAAIVWSIALVPQQPLARLETLVFDTFQKLKPRQWHNSAVTIVDIDETSLKQIGQWPWPRDLVGRLTNILGENGAAAIVFDILFAEPDRTSPERIITLLEKAGVTIQLPETPPELDNDKLFAKAIAQNPVVTAMVFSAEAKDKPPPPKAGMGFGGTNPADILRHRSRAVTNLQILNEPARGMGIMNFQPELDGIVRRTPLIFSAEPGLYPSLSIEALRVAQGAGSFKVNSSDASGEAATGQRAITAVQAGALEIPTDARGEIRIYYSPNREKPVIPAHSLLNPENLPALHPIIEGHIVLVGTSAQGLLDLRSTPLDRVVPGVTIHAEIIDQIISQTFLTRPDWAPGAELTLAILLTLIMLAMLPFRGPPSHAILAALLVAGIAASCWLMFTQQQILLSPLVMAGSVFAAYGAGSAARLLVTESESRFVREAFGQYLAPSLVDQLARDHESLTLGGEEKELTLLFCDIRGFTRLSEGLDPVELTALLNDFLTPMTTVLLEQGATIDKYMGDAIMAFWNAPISQDDHARRACRGLLGMREALKELNGQSDREIAVGIGVNSGPGCVGNLGSEQRFNYSVIGDSVNVASRIEGLTKQYGLDNLVSHSTYDAAKGFAFLEVDRVKVVGRREPLTVYTLLGDEKFSESEDFAKLTETHAKFISSYREGDLQTARKILKRAHEAALPELDTLYAVYDARLTFFAENGFPADWDGVFKAVRK